MIDLDQIGEWKMTQRIIAYHPLPLTILNWVEKMIEMDATTDGKSMEYKLKVAKMQNNLSKTHSKVDCSKTLRNKEV